ncbi:hypothetical protein D3C81_1506700 [compost metagenome]
MDLRVVGNDALGQRKAHGERFQVQRRGHHHGVRDAVVDQRDRQLLGHVVERRPRRGVLVADEGAGFIACVRDFFDAMHGDLMKLKLPQACSPLPLAGEGSVCLGWWQAPTNDYAATAGWLRDGVSSTGTDFDVGVPQPSPVLSSGTSGLVSG